MSLLRHNGRTLANKQQTHNTLSWLTLALPISCSSPSPSYTSSPWKPTEGAWKDTHPRDSKVVLFQSSSWALSVPVIIISSVFHSVLLLGYFGLYCPRDDEIKAWLFLNWTIFRYPSKQYIANGLLLSILISPIFKDTAGGLAVLSTMN